MKRGLKFSLRFSNTHKKTKLDRLWEVYGQVVNEAVLEQEVTGDINEKAFTYLPAAFRQAAKHQAFNLLRINKGDRLPIQTKPSMILDRRFIQVKKSKNSFDYWIKISNLNIGNPVLVPIKSYQHANKYFKEWELVNGARLLRNPEGNWFVQLTFKKPTIRRKVNKAKGLDIGFRKLVADSDGNFYGAEIKELTAKAAKKQQGSKAEKRVREEVKNYIGKTVKEVVNGSADLAIEDLKNLKKNKKGKWSKSMNRRFSYWFYALALQRIRDRCEVVGVQCRSVPPEYTSQTCPTCGHIEKSNRRGEKFCCLQCGFNGDADHIAAINILHRGFAQEAP